MHYTSPATVQGDHRQNRAARTRFVQIQKKLHGSSLYFGSSQKYHFHPAATVQRAIHPARAVHVG
jgi:hypothetical protein